MSSAIQAKPDAVNRLRTSIAGQQLTVAFPACRIDSGVDGSGSRPRRLPPHLAGGFGPPIATRFEPASSSPAPRAMFRLRC